MWAIRFFIVLLFFVETSFGQRNNLIDWKRLNSEDWLSYDRWKVQQYLKDHDSNWKDKLIEQRHREIVGFVIDCINICEIYRNDNGPHQVGLRNKILEGDNISTGKRSYLWLFLMDGTLVRLSPETSLTFKEINLSSKEIFFYARLNWGHILWLSRSSLFYKERDIKETDALFLPLNYFEANTFSLPIKKYKRLNTLIKENNEFTKGKSHYAFLVMSNGTLLLKDGNIEILRQEFSKSYVKLHSDDIFLQEGEREISGLFLYRGLSSTKELSLEENAWYEILKDGRSITVFEEGESLKIGEELIKSIPSILISRELFLKRYASFLSHGYRQWTGMDEDKGELSLRIDFLKDDTQRNESLIISKAEKFFKDVKDRPYDLAHLERHYKILSPRDLTHRDKEQKEGLNSTKKIFWQVINNKRD